MRVNRKLNNDSGDISHSGKVKLLWFSRHDMMDEQKKDLHEKYGDFCLKKLDATIRSAYDIKREIENSDVIAMVAPINILQQAKKIAQDKPVIRPKMIKGEWNGWGWGQKFVGWKVIDGVDVREHDLISGKYTTE